MVVTDLRIAYPLLGEGETVHLSYDVFLGKKTKQNWILLKVNTKYTKEITFR